MEEEIKRAVEALKELGYKVKRWSAACSNWQAYLVGTGIEEAVMVSGDQMAGLVEEVRTKGFPQTGVML